MKSSGNRTSVVVAATAATLMIAALVAGRSARDALFLSHFPAELLPRLMIPAALTSLVAALTLSRALTRFGPARAVPVLYGASALGLILEWTLVRSTPGWAGVALYLHLALFGAVLISGFWSVVNERFDPHSAKKSVGRIAAAAALGGIVGGISADRLTAWLGLEQMFLALALFHGSCALLIRAMGGSMQAPVGAKSARGARHTLHLLLRTPYLGRMAMLVFFISVATASLEYLMKADAAANFSANGGLVSFFAAFYTVTGLATFLTQLSMGTWVLRRFGVGAALSVLPLTIMAGAAGAVFLPRPWSVILLVGLTMVLANSLHRSAFEILYSPIPPEAKRPTKVFVDVGANRMGDFLGGGILFVLLLMPAFSDLLVLAIGAACGVGALAMAFWLRQGYVRQLESSLRSGVLTVDELDVVDSTTERTLAATQAFLDRGTLLEAIEQNRRDRGLPLTEGPEASLASAEEEERLAAKGRALQAAAIALHGGDATEIRRALATRPADPRVVGHVLGFVEGGAHVQEAMDYVRAALPRAAGQVLDAVLDPQDSPVLRRRLARLLESQDSPMVLEGLALGATDEGVGGFDMRVACAQSAARCLTRHPELSTPAGRIWEAIGRELALDGAIWHRQGRRPPGAPERSVLLVGASLQRIDRSLEHVFTLMSLVLDREVMASTLGGLFSGNAHLRGTALEYLELNLPAEIRGALLTRVQVEQAPPPSQRSPEELARELLESSSSIVVSDGDLGT